MGVSIALRSGHAAIRASTRGVRVAAIHSLLGVRPGSPAHADYGPNVDALPTTKTVVPLQARAGE
jgi:hypothetical protein